MCLDHRSLKVSLIEYASIDNGHERLAPPHLMQVYRTLCLYLIHHVHHEVLHHIKIGWWAADLDLAAKSLFYECLQDGLLSFIDLLLRMLKK